MALKPMSWLRASISLPHELTTARAIPIFSTPEPAWRHRWRRDRLPWSGSYTRVDWAAGERRAAVVRHSNRRSLPGQCFRIKVPALSTWRRLSIRPW